MHRPLMVLVTLSVVGFVLATSILAQDVSPPAGATPQTQTLWDIVLAAGTIGFLIIGLSIAAVALTIEQVLSLRRSVLMPAGLASSVQQSLVTGNAAQATQLCQEQPSLLATLIAAGLEEADGGWSAVEKGLEDSAAEQSARMYRKVEYLSVIANISTLLGLLGTVVGLIMAFREVAETQGAARAADLAGGIYLALVTTVEGLVVAIPALAAFAVLRNRLDALVAEASHQALQVFRPLKRGRARRAAANPPAV